MLPGSPTYPGRRKKCPGPGAGDKDQPAERPARSCAPNRPASWEHRQSAAEVRARGPPGPPPAAAAARAHPRAVSLPIWKPRARDKAGGRAGRDGGPRVAMPLRARREALGGAPVPPPGPPLPRRPVPGGPSPASHKFSRPHPEPVPCPLFFSRPGGRPSPGGGIPRSRLLRRASARPAGRRLMCPALPSPSPPPSLLLLFGRRRRSLRLSLLPRPEPLPPPPGPAGRRLRTTRRDGGGGVPPRPGSGGRAARGTRVGGGVPERARGGASA